MKVSTKGRYGLRFSIDVALHGVQHAASLRDIAARMGVSEKYLWQVITPLKSTGLIVSTAGSQGGYQLARPASEITVYDVLRAVEGDLSLVNCTGAKGTCPRSSLCATQIFWNNLSEQMADYMKGTTVQDLADRQQAINPSGSKQTGVDYCI